jgi:Ni,Fe-hydrogenase maturation factor
MRDILIYGIGNPGRQDDSLGVSFATCMEDWVTKNNLDIDVEYNYQLNVEDAARISLHKLVIFADATKEIIEKYYITRVIAKASNGILSHAVNPESILFLCKELFAYQPEAFVFHIKGYEWEFGEPVTKNALNNLQLALKEIQNILKHEIIIEKLVNSLDNIVMPAIH